MQTVLANITIGPSATTIVRLSAGRGATGRGEKTDVQIEQHEPRSMASLLPQVLARYGLSEATKSAEMQPGRQLDLFA